FPHATFLGVDLIPCPRPTSDIPANCMFEIDDINQGLEHFEGKFDLVHVSNYRKTMEEISLCLKPGGLALFIDGDFELLEEDRTTVLPMALTDREIREIVARSEREGRPLSEAEKKSLEEGSWLQRMLYEMVSTAHLNGCDTPGAEEAIDEGLWRMNLYDPDSCGASSVFLPVSPWPKMRDIAESEQVQYAGALIRKDIHSMLDQWITAADWELATQKYRAWVRWRVAWGRRKRRKGRDTSSGRRGRGNSDSGATSPSPSSPSSDAQRSFPLHHQIEVYNSREEALSAKEARLSTRVQRPEPLVVRMSRG
ncbi:hypothetical protein FRC17_001199, partial [Serendipita sp. 399]